MNQLGLVRPVDRLGQSVVVAIATASHGWLDAGLGQALGVANAGVLRPCRSDRPAALNCRLTLSRGRGTVLSKIVVRTSLPRITPRIRGRRMNLSTVQRAPAVPSRASWHQTLSAPWTCMLAFQTHSISGTNAPSR